MSAQKQNCAAQLRGLRLLLGKDNKPVTGEVLATLTGMALGTVHATEAGTRLLNARDRQRIVRALCAQWNDRKNKWVDARDGKTPFSRELYERYRQAIYSQTSPDLRDMEALMCSLRAVYYLLQKLPDSTYYRALFDLHDTLQEIAQTFEAPPEVFTVLEALAPIVKTTTNPKLPLRGEEDILTFRDLNKANEFVALIKSSDPSRPSLPFKVLR